MIDSDSIKSSLSSFQREVCAEAPRKLLSQEPIYTIRIKEYIIAQHAITLFLTRTPNTIQVVDGLVSMTNRGRRCDHQSRQLPWHDTHGNTLWTMRRASRAYFQRWPTEQDWAALLCKLSSFLLNRQKAPWIYLNLSNFPSRYNI